LWDFDVELKIVFLFCSCAKLLSDFQCSSPMQNFEGEVPSLRFFDTSPSKTFLYLRIFIWGVRWSAWVWPGQKTMAPTGFEPPSTDGPQKKFGISKKSCFCRI
jgi:hypothetical protein